MRVLMTADTVGGVWSYALELCAALAERDVRVTLATMGAPLSRGQRRAVDAIPDVEVCESAYRLEWMRAPWADVERAGQWLARLADRVRPDVVHLNSYAHGDLDWGAPVLVVAHSCVLSWWSAVKGEPAPSEWDEYRRRVGRGLAAADLVAAPTRAMLDAVTHHHGVAGPGQVIANGRDPSRYRVAHAEPFVLSIGRLWDEAKNVAALDAASEELPWPVYVAGPADHPDGHRVEPRGAIPLGSLAPHAIADWMARASIYALPARYEPFGLSALEAALSGCALVLGDIRSLREIWDGAAVFADPDDPDALRRAIGELIDAPGERGALAARARERALELTPGQMAAAYHAAYRRLATPAEAEIHERGAP